MISLIGTLNTELPPQLRACSHIILLSMYTHICVYVGASLAPFYLIHVVYSSPLLSSGHYGLMQPTTYLTLQPTIGLIESICMLHSCNHYRMHHNMFSSCIFMPIHIQVLPLMLIIISLPRKGSYHFDKGMKKFFC
jgi:hypothetical protein